MDGTGSSQLIVMGNTSAPGVYDSTFANPEEWLWEALSGGSRSDSGIHVNADTALHFAPWFQGISIISGDVARVPLDVFERTDDDSREKRRDHPAFELLNRQSNEWMTSFTVRETLLSHALSYGNGYAAIEWQRGKPVAIVPLMPDVTSPVLTPGGGVVYVTHNPDGTERTFKSQDILHIRGLGTGLLGISVFRYACDSLGLGLAAERHSSRHFRNDARPGVILSHPAKLDPVVADQLLDNWERRHGADPNRPALASGGLTATVMPVSNQDAQLIETRKFQREDIASFLCLPSHKLNSDSKLAYNSSESAERAYVGQTLMRWFKRFESECDSKLLSIQEKRAWWYTEHNTGALIQGDFTTQTKVAVEQKNAMIITRNEARKKFNLNAVEGGDEFENANTSKASDTVTADDQPDDPTPDDEAMAAHRELIVDRVAKLAKTERAKLKSLAKGNAPVDSIERWYAGFAGKFSDAIRPCLRVLATVMPCSVKADDVASRYCGESMTAIREVCATIEPGQLPGAIEATIQSWPDTRPQQVVEWITGETK